MASRADDPRSRRQALGGTLRPLLRAAQAGRTLWRGVRRPITLGCRALVAAPGAGRGHRVLLVRHSYVDGWHLPGGGVGRGETMKEAALRELAEETGIRPEGPARLLGLFLRLTQGNSDHVAVYVVEGWSGDPAGDGLEILDARFFDTDALPEDTAPATRRRIEEWLGLKPVDERW